MRPSERTRTCTHRYRLTHSLTSKHSDCPACSPNLATATRHCHRHTTILLLSVTVLVLSSSVVCSAVLARSPSEGGPKPLAVVAQRGACEACAALLHAVVPRAVSDGSMIRFG
ncbi:hypothetical protein M758_4G265100 [Ceratodon purpureus]|nr:hypothetical protein M758_4G265100 [Ceratodon purpureus]